MISIKSRLKNFTLTAIINVIDYFYVKYNFTSLRIFKRILQSFKGDLIYLIEESNWAIEWVGRYITTNLRKFNLIDAEIASHYFAKNKIIHYGSKTCLIRDKNIIHLDDSNIHILTCFHITPQDDIVKIIPYLNKKLDFIHTSNIIMKNLLIELGFDKNKTLVIPLGVDLSLFRRYDLKFKSSLRQRFKLPHDKIIIGSFQKDGMENGAPIERKAPDVFCNVLNNLKEKFDIHIFLTGPGRDYVKKKLDEYNIPYTHTYLDDYREMVYCYNCLDLYLITSRIEGGPLSLLECMATGVPIITTKVGMAPEIIKNGFNGFIIEIDDIEKLYDATVEILENQELRDKIIKNGLVSIKQYSWERITEQYYKKMYCKFFEK